MFGENLVINGLTPWCRRPLFKGGGRNAHIYIFIYLFIYLYMYIFIEGSLEVKLPTIWTDEKQSREEAERRGRLEERRVEEKE